MRKIIIPLFTLILMMGSALSFAAPKAKTGKPAVKAAGLDGVAKTFQRPPSEFGGAPFWSWDEKIEPGEMKTQIKELSEGGFGGFFIHAREGRITPYLGKEWMDGVKLSVAEAKKRNMKAYLYDEDRWPSGFAGGIVPRENPGFRQKGLTMIESDKPLPASEFGPDRRLVRVFAVARAGNALASWRDVTPKTGTDAAAFGGGTLLYFVQVFARRSDWFNDTSYIDTLNPKAIDAFLRSTYDAYYKAVGSEFGKTVPAIFTDEPCYLMRNDFPSATLPWTEEFPKYFKAANGYDIRDKLPLLFYTAKGSKKVRLDFRTSATERFRDTFGKRIFDWTEKHDIKFTGHYMCEDNLVTQTDWIGAAMPLYEYQRMPGMDHLGRNINDVMTAKQLSSAAHQFGWPLVLTELYGCSGWNVSFEDMKWIADWHYALGVNFMNEHLAWYTMRGERKRDYPASIHYQSPWWPYHKTLGDYVRRATYITSQGDYLADALILHPITSAWSVYSPLDGAEAQKLNTAFTSLLMFFSARQVDYDFGDEIIISRHGRVDKDRFIVGKMSYRAVVVPPGVTLRESTVKLLKKFIAAGGPVVMIAPAPTLVDADRPLKLDGAVTVKDNDEALARIAGKLPLRVELASNDGGSADSVYLQQRQINGSRFLYFANTDQEKIVDGSAVIPLKGKVRAWNLFNGRVETIPSETIGGKIRVPVHLEPSGSLLLSVSPAEAPVPPAHAPLAQTLVEYTPVDAWSVAKQDMNALTIDFINYRREGETEWSDRLPQYVIQNSLLSKGANARFSLRYNFNMGFDPKTAKRLYFVMEQPRIYTITVNGKPVKYTEQGWWRDRQWKRIDIRDVAVEGRNVVEVTGTFFPPRIGDTRNYAENGVEVEAAYVVGDFSVRNEPGEGYILRPPATEAKAGNLVTQGFPFFSGSITLARDVEIKPWSGQNIFLEFEGLETILADVSVNGRHAGLIAFHPHRLDITPFAKPGTNRVEVTLVNSNRNLMGPLHHFDKEPLSVGPGDFKQTATKKYNFVRFGMMKGMRIAYYK